MQASTSVRLRVCSRYAGTSVRYSFWTDAVHSLRKNNVPNLRSCEPNISIAPRYFISRHKFEMRSNPATADRKRRRTITPMSDLHRHPFPSLRPRTMRPRPLPILSPRLVPPSTDQPGGHGHRRRRGSLAHPSCQDVSSVPHPRSLKAFELVHAQIYHFVYR